MNEPTIETITEEQEVIKQTAIITSKERKQLKKYAKLVSLHNHGKRNNAVVIITPKGEQTMSYKNAEKKGLLIYEWSWK